MSLINISDFENFSPIFKGKFGNALAKGLMHLLSADAACELYDKSAKFTGPDFAEAVMRNSNADYLIGNIENLRVLKNPNFITISNHPYGGIDGIILADLFGHIAPNYKIMVNKVLSIIKALEPNFITVIPTGEIRTAASEENINGVLQTFRHIKDGNPMGFFPAGAVSDLSLKEGKIRDREWQEPLIRLIKKAKVPVVPVRFFDRNTLFFYLLGLISWKIRLLRLPKEVVNKGGEIIRVGIGKVISVEEQNKISDITEFTQMLRSSVYDMPLPEDFTLRSKMDF